MMKRLKGSMILMMLAILGVTGFQLYWLRDNYMREKQNLSIRMSSSFTETIDRLQKSKLKLEQITINMDTLSVPRQAVYVRSSKKQPAQPPLKPAQPSPKSLQAQSAVSLMKKIQEKLRDSLVTDSNFRKSFVVSLRGDTSRLFRIDTVNNAGGTIRSIGFNGPLDSLIPDPSMIREVHVTKANMATGQGGGVIRIGYGQPGQKDSFINVDTGAFFRRISKARADRTGILPERFPLLVPEKEIRAAQQSPAGLRGNAVFSFLYNIDSMLLKDSVKVKEIDSAYLAQLKEQLINVRFKVRRLDSAEAIPPDAVTLGVSQPVSYTYTVTDSFSYMFGKLKIPVLFSLLLIGITIVSFTMLYRNMRKQQRLAELKNEFISNITHELKTPIATVGVAIEALKSFNAIHDPQRTQEYLDISQNELQRLNLLVDKVLKLSMFEKKEIELKYEWLHLEDVVTEVVSSMRLQVEKFRATVSVNTEGDCSLQADRLHLLSVVFNLLDNALKYGGNDPQIRIGLEEKEQTVQLTVTDNGIGIPAEFRGKVFDKFFRVPHGDTHNAKGYGLGLSYVAHVVKKHKGTISVESGTGNGTTFTIILPKQHT